MAVQTPASLNARLNINVHVNTRVTKIDTARKNIIALNEATRESYQESYDELILAVGAAPFKPPIPGIDRPGLCSLRSLEDMDNIVSWLEKKEKSVKPGDDMHALVCGAGFIGLEMVEQLLARGYSVSLVEMLPQILGPMDPEMAAYLHKDLEQRGVDVILNDAIAEFTADSKDSEATIVRLKSGKTLMPAHLTILGLGVRPDTDVVKEAGIELTPRGHIVVDDHLQTSTPHVWAVGDAVQVKNPILEGEMWAIPLAGPANRQGRMVADNIYGLNRSYKGTWGVSVVRSFQLYAACVGLNEKFLMAKNLPYSAVHIHPNSHAGYYPGAAKVHLKLLFDHNNGKIYGAQAVGEDGIEKRIDVIATAMQGNLTVEDLAELELCYAPPVGSAKDPVNYAGMVAQNICEGLVSNVSWRELEKLANDENTLLLDVRSPDEMANRGVAKNIVNIRVDDLRKRIAEVPKEKNIVISCETGQRAYYASRILKQNGYENVSILDGAYQTFHVISEPVE